MSIRPIIDAGPGPNFLSANKERLLIAVLGALSAPETVRNEVLRNSRQDDLGETMVIAHAVVAAESRQPVTVNVLALVSVGMMPEPLHRLIAAATSRNCRCMPR